MAMRPVRVALLLVALLLAVVGHMPAVSATRMLLADDEHAGHSPDEHAAATAGTAHTTSSSKTAVGIAVSAVHGTKPLVDTSTAAVKPVPLLIPHPVAKNVPGSDGSHHEPEFEAVFDPEHEYEYGNDEDDEFFPEDEYAEHEKVLPGVLPGFEALSSPVKVVRTAPHEPVFSTPREYEKVYEAQYDGYGEDDDEFLAYEHDVAEVGDYFPENVAIDTVSVTASASATSGATAAGSTASRPIPEAPKPSVVAPEHDVHDIHYTYVLPDHVDHLEHVGHVDTSVVAVPRTVVSPVKAAVQKTTDASKPTALASDMHDEMHEHARGALHTFIHSSPFLQPASDSVV